MYSNCVASNRTGNLSGLIVVVVVVARSVEKLIENKPTFNYKKLLKKILESLRAKTRQLEYSAIEF